MFQQKVFSLMEYRGEHDPGFHEILDHSPYPAFIKLKSFCWNTWIYKVSHEICQISWNLLNFMWNPPDFMKSTEFHEYELLGDPQV